MPPPAIPAGEILFATDLSDSSQRLLQSVKQIARYLRRPARVVHVIELTGRSQSFFTVQASAERALRQICHELKLAGVSETGTIIAAGSVPSALREAVTRYRPAFVVLGCRDANGPASAPLGATPCAALRDLPCPVCLIGPQCASRTALDRPLIVATPDTAALQEALETWPAPVENLSACAVGPAKKRAQLILEVAGHPIPVPVIPLSRHLTAAAASQIATLAATTGSGLIVLHPDSPLTAGSLFGALSVNLVRNAACPALIIRPTAEQPAP